MERDNDAGAGEALEGIHRIHPVLDRLRDLLTSAAALDLKASSKGYWSERDDTRPISSP